LDSASFSGPRRKAEQKLFACSAISVGQFVEGRIHKSRWIALSLIDVAEDYSRQELLGIGLAVSSMRDTLTGSVEGSGHESYRFRVVGSAVID
jgi:hypothetical protein